MNDDDDQLRADWKAGKLKIIGCPVCADLSIEPEHPQYADPQMGDQYHGQYDPEHPEEVTKTMAKGWFDFDSPNCLICGNHGGHCDKDTHNRYWQMVKAEQESQIRMRKEGEAMARKGEPFSRVKERATYMMTQITDAQCRLILKRLIQTVPQQTLGALTDFCDLLDEFDIARMESEQL